MLTERSKGSGFHIGNTGPIFSQPLGEKQHYAICAASFQGRWRSNLCYTFWNFKQINLYFCTIRRLNLPWACWRASLRRKGKGQCRRPIFAVLLFVKIKKGLEPITSDALSFQFAKSKQRAVGGACLMAPHFLKELFWIFPNPKPILQLNYDDSTIVRLFKLNYFCSLGRCCSCQQSPRACAHATLFRIKNYLVSWIFE